MATSLPMTYLFGTALHDKVNSGAQGLHHDRRSKAQDVLDPYHLLSQMTLCCDKSDRVHGRCIFHYFHACGSAIEATI
jgi:hypothetical protein